MRCFGGFNRHIFTKVSSEKYQIRMYSIVFKMNGILSVFGPKMEKIDSLTDEDQSFLSHHGWQQFYIDEAAGLCSGCSQG